VPIDREAMSIISKILIVGALAGFGLGLAGPLAAQSLGMPNWSNPKGGTGITISGDFAKPNSDLGNGTAWGARGAFGFGAITLTAALASWKPSGASDSSRPSAARPRSASSAAA